MKKVQIQVTEPVWTHIQTKKQLGETHSDTLERLLGLKNDEKKED